MMHGHGKTAMHHRAGPHPQGVENSYEGHAEQGQDFYLLSCGYP